MSVFVPSGYLDRHVDYPSLITFYLRDTLKNCAARAFAAQADTLHVYNGHTHSQWHAARDIEQVKQLVRHFQEGSMIVVAPGNQSASPDYEQLAQDIRTQGLIQSAEQFLIVKQGKETQLQQGRFLSQLQIS